MKTNKLFILAILFLLAACQTTHVGSLTEGYNDILLSCEDEKAILPGSYITKVELSKDLITIGIWTIRIYLNTEGAIAFGDITKRNVGKRLSMSVLGKELILASIAEPILNGKIIISGYSYKEANDIIKILKIGNAK